MNFLNQYNAGGVTLEPRLPFSPPSLEKDNKKKTEEKKKKKGARGGGAPGANLAGYMPPAPICDYL